MPRHHFSGPPTRDVDDGDNLKGHHPVILHLELLPQLRLLLQVLQSVLAARSRRFEALGIHWTENTVQQQQERCAVSYSGAHISQQNASNSLQV